MNREELIARIRSAGSMLCVGLDTDPDKLPQGFSRDTKGITEFNRIIIEATHELSAAYKINTAFYEQLGTEGWMCMEKTLSFIPDHCLTIADAKRGDIGNTSAMYAKAFFERMNFDAITVAPYMGEDSLRPFFNFKDKWVICLGLTSNAGSRDFQMLETNGKPLYMTVMEKTADWGTPENLMFVTGATHPEQLAELRKSFPEHFFLVPGVGAQGGSVEDVCRAAGTQFGGLLINSSRGILYASSGPDFAEKAHEEALKIQQACAQSL